MSLNTSLSIASSGLSAVQYELGVASQNVANASTPGYVTEVANVASRDAGGQGSGVVIKLTTRAVNDTLQNSLYTQNATVAGLGVTVNALSAVSAVQGSTSADVSSSNTLADNLGNLQNSFTALDANPSNTVDQQAVVSSAGTLANSIQTLSSTYQTQRQDAEQAIPSEVATINANLNTIGALSTQIMQLRNAGDNTADLENQRSAAMTTLSSSVSVKFAETSAGDMLVSTTSGLGLPTHATSGPLSVQQATIGVADAYPGSIPGIMLNNQDVTASLAGGTLGANITLRDTTLPTMQGELDAFSSTLASRFSSQGLVLFTNGSGNSPGTNPTTTPPTGQLGFSGSIQVNALVAATPSLVRDGTSGSNTTGSAGYTTVISNILNYALGTTDATGATQAAATSSGLGVNGSLSAPYAGTGSLVTLATTLTASQAQTISDATTRQSSQTDIQTTLQANLATTSGVSVDDQMANVVALQNAYESNAKVITAVQAMFSALLAAVT